jgi:hypothetical protein
MIYDPFPFNGCYCDYIICDPSHIMSVGHGGAANARTYNLSLEYDRMYCTHETSRAEPIVLAF